MKTNYFLKKAFLDTSVLYILDTSVLYIKVLAIYLSIYHLFPYLCPVLLINF